MGYFFPGCYGRGADSEHHFGKPVRACFAILTSFEMTPLIWHGRRPRILKMKCIAQKLTKWWRIDKLGRKREMIYFRKLKELRYVQMLPIVDKVSLISLRVVRFWRQWSLWLRNYKWQKVKKRQCPKFLWIVGITEFLSHGQNPPPHD